VSARGRRWAFGIAAAGLAGGAFLIAGFGARPASHSSSPADGQPTTVASGPAQDSAGRGEADRGQPKPYNGSHVQARQFLDAFFTYQESGATSHVRAAFAATVTARLRRYLGASPRRAPRRRARARVASLQLYRLTPDQIKASAIVNRGRRPSLLEFLLTRSRGQWRVSEAFP
jgi:hypothetical protein